MGMIRILFYLSVPFLFIPAFAEQPILFRPQQQEYLAGTGNVRIFKTKNDRLTMDSVLALPDSVFVPIQSFVNDDPDAVYWLTCTLDQQQNAGEKWILEILDSR